VLFLALKVKKIINSVVPITEWIPNYNVSRDLLSDVAAGITVGVVHLPQGKDTFLFEFLFLKFLSFSNYSNMNILGVWFLLRPFSFFYRVQTGLRSSAKYLIISGYLGEFCIHAEQWKHLTV